MVHIFDFRKDIYGREIEIFFKKQIRKEIKFNNLDELKDQLSKDEILARKILESERNF